VIDAVLAEEGRPPESIFDFVQGITAVARDKPHQDARLDMEAKAKKLLDRAVQLIDHLKKSEMAREAERLLGETHWPPSHYGSPKWRRRRTSKKHCRSFSPTTRRRRTRSSRSSRHRLVAAE
jgi:hypothetical protein